MENKIYFDNGSTSFPKAPGVAQAVASLLENGAFNINRGSYEGAYEVADKVLDTREKLAALFHAESSRQVVFTPGITYSLNYFIKGFLRSGDHVIVSSMEHNAVMRPLKQMEEQGVTYSAVYTDEEGNVLPGDVEREIKANTRAVIMLHASNVCGTIVPIQETGRICKKYGLYFAVDSAQTAGTIEVDMQQMNIDFLAFTGHKGLLGPQGIGGFLISDRLNENMVPYIAGGTGSQSDSLYMPGQLPDKYESGTMNLPGIIGLHAALSYIEKQGLSNIHRKKMELAGAFLEQVKQLPGVKIIGRKDLKERVAVVSLDFDGQDNAVLAFRLEQEYGIMTRVGLHCAPMAHKSLHTYPQGTVRFAFSADNKYEEIERCTAALRELLSI
ncbi:aminotransferase class V-fold PLP-dependent enzyme [[Clostridium] hylemonae]|uniref:cysteine desulfurase n=1 Tax=[Clostridium] hylemonae DSM 15053 TaxID=553973 RepID=C0C4L0_9FIRM|nr:aminotransferase class V-fold PLP-dependent enzyme [[Clostridium] hylemonae]EEG73003.1 cysteine desulfurase family protein [[Clostridium] hylemonae DSM 15053]QEK16252.1 Cysteine desulfurase SufS [[Clostridium] hylemonae DSM 15053]